MIGWAVLGLLVAYLAARTLWAAGMLLWFLGRLIVACAQFLLDIPIRIVGWAGRGLLDRLERANAALPTKTNPERGRFRVIPGGLDPGRERREAS